MDNDSKASTCPDLQTSYSLDHTISNTHILSAILMALHGRGLVSWSAKGGSSGQHRRRWGRTGIAPSVLPTSLCSCHLSPHNHCVYFHSLCLSVGNFPQQLGSILFIGQQIKLMPAPAELVLPLKAWQSGTCTSYTPFHGFLTQLPTVATCFPILFPIPLTTAFWGHLTMNY